MRPPVDEAIAQKVVSVVGGLALSLESRGSVCGNTNKVCAQSFMPTLPALRGRNCHFLAALVRRMLIVAKPCQAICDSKDYLQLCAAPSAR
jgi:hypothetical protein